MIKNIFSNWLLKTFCILWAVYLFLDYFYHSGNFLSAFSYLEYTGLLFTIFIITLGVTYSIANKKKPAVEIEIKYFRGIYHYLFVLIMMFTIMLFYVSKTEISSNAFAASLSFIFRTILFHAGLGIILLASLSIGVFFLDFLKLSTDRSSNLLIGLATGFFIVTMVLFLLGSLGLLYQYVLFPLLIILIIPGIKKTFSLLKQTLFDKSKPFKIHILAVLSYALILLFVSIMFIFNTRTFPLGFDSLGLYMNTSKLIAGYHALTQGGDAYNWSLFMSLGYILYNNTTIAILLSTIPGVLSILAIYKISTTLGVNRNWSLYACALFYSLPNTVWQSKNDEKTDLALLFITLCSVLLLQANTSSAPIKKKNPGALDKLLTSNRETVVWAVCGLLIGFTFGIKYVAMLSIFAMLVLLFYNFAGKYGAIAVFFFNFAVIFGLDLTKFAAFNNDMQLLSTVVPALLSMIALVIAFRQNTKGVLMATRKAFVFCVAIGITFLPWALKNGIENKNVSIDALLSGKSPLPELYAQFSSNPSTKLSQKNEAMKVVSNPQSQAVFAGIGVIGREQQIGNHSSLSVKKDEVTNPGGHNSSNEKSYTNKEKEEEIRRYLGYESGLIRFVSLPYDIAMKINVRLTPSDSGILVWILLPVFLLIFSMRQLPWNLLKIFSLLLVLILSLISVQLLKGSMDNTSIHEAMKSIKFSGPSIFNDVFLTAYVSLKSMLLHTGSYLLPAYTLLTTQSLGLCFVLLTLLSIPLYFAFKGRLKEFGQSTKALIVIVYCIIQYWLILSSGIIWYGIVGFSILPILFAAFSANRDNSTAGIPFLPAFVASCSLVWFVFILPFQFMPTKFLYQKDMKNINFSEFIDPVFAKYAIGEKSEREVFNQFFTPAQQNIIQTLNRDKQAKILNVSTFFNYFIVNNDTRIFKDNQLGIFNEMYTRAKNLKSQTVKEFRKNNIKYVLISLKTADIDKTPDKSLTKKFETLMGVMINNPEIQLRFTNRIVARPDGDLNLNINGAQVKAKYDVVGASVINPGSDALFEIL